MTRAASARFCSDACKQAAYRARKRTREQTRQRAEDDARRQREEQARRARSRRPPEPPAAAPCWQQPARPVLRLVWRPPGAAHLHHDQAAHDRARRRYDGLDAKAASTGFPEEADACRAKAEQLRSKYGL